MLKRILVGVSGAGDPSAKARFAINLAHAHAATITLMAVTDINRLENVGPVPVGAAYYAKRLREHRVEQSHAGAERGLKHFADDCAAAGVETRIVRADAEPVESLLAAWRYHDLCLLSLRHWFDEDVVAGPSDAPLRLLAGGMRPLLAIPPTHRPVRRVMIAYNGSLESAKAMKQFVQMALWAEAELRIVCVGPAKSGERAETMLDEAAQYCRAHGRQVAVTHSTKTGDDTLNREAARAQADAIVMGSSYRRVLLSQRFGRNAAAMIKSSTLPLFLSH